MKIKSLRTQGFTLVEIMIVVAIIGLLASIAIPNFVRARETSQKNACINNLRQIDGAAQTWALETGKTSSDTYTIANIKPYLRLDTTGNVPPCPAGGVYTPGTVISNAPTCNIAGHAMP
jgi:prepilin-type N-terminal cleavage/methylation domain-containing protein